MRGAREGRAEDESDMERAQGLQYFQLSSSNYRNINLIESASATSNLSD